MADTPTIRGGAPPGYDTPLTDMQKVAYQTWRAALPPNLQNSGDYDLQGAYLAAAQADGRLHMTDQFKKPNHPTFSDGSQYVTPQTPGGHWSDTGQPNPVNPAEHQWVFWGSPTNLMYRSLPDLAHYFATQEQGNTLVAPVKYTLPPGTP